MRRCICVRLVKFICWKCKTHYMSPKIHYFSVSLLRYAVESPRGSIKRRSLYYFYPISNGKRYIASSSFLLPTGQIRNNFSLVYSRHSCKANLIGRKIQHLWIFCQCNIDDLNRCHANNTWMKIMYDFNNGIIDFDAWTDILFVCEC